MSALNALSGRGELVDVNLTCGAPGLQFAGGIATQPECARTKEASARAAGIEDSTSSRTTRSWKDDCTNCAALLIRKVIRRAYSAPCDVRIKQFSIAELRGLRFQSDNERVSSYVT